MRKWFFQANPRLYDIEAALRDLERIWWRVPQYTSDIHTNDVVIVWRSGSESGVVGVGRVLDEPQQHDVPPNEAEYVLAPEIGADETRVPIAVVPVTYLPKQEVMALSGFKDHPIITAPMGTVIPISEVEFDAMAPYLPEPPPRCRHWARAIAPVGVCVGAAIQERSSDARWLRCISGLAEGSAREDRRRAAHDRRTS